MTFSLIDFIVLIRWIAHYHFFPAQSIDKWYPTYIGRFTRFKPCWIKGIFTLKHIVSTYFELFPVVISYRIVYLCGAFSILYLLTTTCFVIMYIGSWNKKSVYVETICYASSFTSSFWSEPREWNWIKFKQSKR